MDWFLYDRDLRYERILFNLCAIPKCKKYPIEMRFPQPYLQVLKEPGRSLSETKMLGFLLKNA